MLLGILKPPLFHDPQPVSKSISFDGSFENSNFKCGPISPMGPRAPLCSGAFKMAGYARWPAWARCRSWWAWCCSATWEARRPRSVIRPTSSSPPTQLSCTPWVCYDLLRTLWSRSESYTGKIFHSFCFFFYSASTSLLPDGNIPFRSGAGIFSLGLDHDRSLPLKERNHKIYPFLKRKV